MSNKPNAELSGLVQCANLILSSNKAASSCPEARYPIWQQLKLGRASKGCAKPRQVSSQARNPVLRSRLAHKQHQTTIDFVSDIMAIAIRTLYNTLVHGCDWPGDIAPASAPSTIISHPSFHSPLDCLSTPHPFFFLSLYYLILPTNPYLSLRKGNGMFSATHQKHFSCRSLTQRPATSLCPLCTRRQNPTCSKLIRALIGSPGPLS